METIQINVYWKYDLNNKNNLYFWNKPIVLFFILSLIFWWILYEIYEQVNRLRKQFKKKYYGRLYNFSTCIDNFNDKINSAKKRIIHSQQVTFCQKLEKNFQIFFSRVTTQLHRGCWNGISNNGQIESHLLEITPSYFQLACYSQTYHLKLDVTWHILW